MPWYQTQKGPGPSGPPVPPPTAPLRGDAQGAAELGQGTFPEEAGPLGRAPRGAAPVLPSLCCPQAAVGPPGSESCCLPGLWEGTCIPAQPPSPCVLPQAACRVQKVPECPPGGHLGGQGPALCPAGDTWWHLVLPALHPSSAGFPYAGPPAEVGIFTSLPAPRRMVPRKPGGWDKGVLGSAPL